MQSLMSADTGYSSTGQINIPKMRSQVEVTALGMKVVNLLEWNARWGRAGVGSGFSDGLRSV